MASLQAQRTLVKSRPELWAEVSDVDSLCRHLAQFGDITITSLQPETTVAWEGTAARGTVELEASGWGTRVTLTAEPVAAAEPEPVPEPEPVAVVSPEPVRAPEPGPVAATVPEPVREVPAAVPVPPVPPVPRGAPARRGGLLGRLLGRWAPRAAPAPPAQAEAPADPPLRILPTPEPARVVPLRRPAPTPDEGGDRTGDDAEPEPDPPLVAQHRPAGEGTGPAPPPEPGPGPLDAERTVAALTAALDDLGAAHRRPFSRS